MPRLNSFYALAGVFALAFPATGAIAADAMTVPTTASVEAVPVYDNSGFDWNGFYVGVFGATQQIPGAEWEYGGGVLAGVNTQLDFYLLGGEVALSGLGDGSLNRAYGEVLAHGGLVVTDEMVLYAAAGYGADLSAAPDEHWLAGGGLEYAVTDNLSVRGQYLHGFAANGASTDTNKVTLGINYHF